MPVALEMGAAAVTISEEVGAGTAFGEVESSGVAAAAATDSREAGAGGVAAAAATDSGDAGAGGVAAAAATDSGDAVAATMLVEVGAGAIKEIARA